MRRALLIPGCLVLVGLCVTAFGFSCVYLWSGGYELTVTVDTTHQTPEWVYCLPVPRWEKGERWLGPLLDAPKSGLAGGHDSALADPFRGQPLKVQVWLDGCHSPIFGELSDPQLSRHLLIIAEMPDGQRVGKIVDIPDYRRSKAVKVSVP